MSKLIHILALWFGLSGSVMGCTTPPTIPINSGVSKSSNMYSKKCNDCKSVKLISDFQYSNYNTDKLQGVCKHCQNNRAKEYQKTKNGLVAKMYSNQVYRSKIKGYNSITYTMQELRSWIFEQETFNELFSVWVIKNYKKELIPSIDRINDYKGYSLDNIQLMTWGENNNKGHSDRKNGINNKLSKTIIAINIDTGKRTEFYSMAKGKKVTGASHIHDCCNGVRKSSGGCKWEYKFQKI